MHLLFIWLALGGQLAILGLSWLAMKLCDTEVCQSEARLAFGVAATLLNTAIFSYIYIISLA